MDTFITRDDAPNNTLESGNVQLNGGAGSVTYSSEFDETGSMNVNELSSFSPDGTDYTKDGVNSVLGRARSMDAPIVKLPNTPETKQAVIDLGANHAEDGDKLAVVPQSTPDYNLLGLQTSEALQGGHSEEDLKAYLKEKKGLTDTQLERVMGVATKANEAFSQGYSVDEVKGYLDSKTVVETSHNTDPLVPDEDDTEWAERQFSAKEKEALGWFADSEAVQMIYGDVSKTEPMTASDLLAKMETVYPNMADPLTKAQGLLGDKQAQRRSKALAKASRAKMFELATQYGLEMGYDDLTGQYYAVQDGQKVAVDSGFWNSLDQSKFEIGGATVGGMVGLGLPVPAMLKPVTGVVGAAVGGMVGSQFDYFKAVFELQQEVDAKVMYSTALDAGAQEVFFSVLGGTIGKLGSTGYHGIKNAVETLWSGNEKLAMKELTNITGISEAEAQEITTRLTALIKDGKAADIGDVASDVLKTTPEGHKILGEIVSSHPEKARVIRQEVRDRARSLKDAVFTEDTGEQFLKGVNEYRSSVKRQYKLVKDEVANSPRLGNFRFNYDALALDPVLKKLDEAALHNPMFGHKFFSLANKIRETGKGRTLEDLINLRQLVNEVKYGSKQIGFEDKKMLNGMLSNIDKTIESGAGVVFKDPKRWLDDWKLARQSYAEMKTLDDTSLSKLVKGIKDGTRVMTDDALASELAKQMASVGTDANVLNKLSPKVRTNVERGVLNHLTKKFSSVSQEGYEAVDWVALSSEVNKLKLGTDDAKITKYAINEFAKVFKNDPALGKVYTNMGLGKEDTILATSLRGVAERKIIGQTWGVLTNILDRKSLRSMSGRRYLVNKVVEALDNPLNMRTMDELKSEFKKHGLDMNDDLMKLQQGAAEEAGKSTKIRVKSTKGGTVDVRPDRVATTGTVATTIGLVGSAKVADNYLKNEGYVAVEAGEDKVRPLY